MKKISIFLIITCILIVNYFITSSCDSNETGPFPPPQTSSQEDTTTSFEITKITRNASEQASNPTPEQTIEITLSQTVEPDLDKELITMQLDYVIIDSYTEIVKVLYTDDFEISGLDRESEFGDPVPKGFVVLKNIDNVAGRFTVVFSFWNRDKITVVEDGEEISWYPMPDIEAFRNYHRGEVSLTLQPGEIGIAEFIAFHISWYETRDKGPWFWEFEVIPGTKTVEIS